MTSFRALSLVLRDCILQPLIDLRFGGCDPSLGFLLEKVENPNRICDLHRVDSPPRIAVEGLGNLNDACSAEALERLGIRVLPTPLRKPDGVADTVFDLVRAVAQVLLRAPHPSNRLGRRTIS